MRFLLLVMGLLCCVVFAQAQTDLATPFEQSKGLECATYDEVLDYCERLDNSSELISFQMFGKSSMGFDLPLLVLDKDGLAYADDIRKSGRAVFLIQASIHAGEPDGTSAGLMLMRNLVSMPEYELLLDKVSVVFMPVLNADGYNRRSKFNRINQNGPIEMGWRTNAQNINMNRDYLRAATPAIREWHKVFEAYRPDFFVDCHTTDGADYQYAITYDLPIYGNMEANQTQWMKEKYLAPLEKQMAAMGYPMFRYVSFKSWFDPTSGIVSWVSSPMLSQGYTAVKNRAGLLIETHMLKDYKTRVEATYQTILESIKLVASDAEQLISLNASADKMLEDGNLAKTRYALSYEASEKSRDIIFKGVASINKKSDLTNKSYVSYKTGEYIDIPMKMYDDVHPQNYAYVPSFYVIPPQYSAIIESLDIHSIEYSIIENEKEYSAMQLKFNNVEFASAPYEGAFRVLDFNTDTIYNKVMAPTGSYIVPSNQKNIQVAIHLIDPLAASSLLKWGYFNAIFEQKEYGEMYVMEVVAQEMIDENPELLKEFKAFLKENPDVKKNQYEQLNWFYQRSPYWDKSKNVYPILYVD